MDDTTAIEIMQRFGQAFFKRDRRLLAEVLCADAQARLPPEHRTYLALA